MRLISGGHPFRELAPSGLSKALATYGKSLNQSSSLSEAINPADPGLSKALSAIDLRQNLVVSYKYELPVERIAHRRDRLTEG